MKQLRTGKNSSKSESARRPHDAQIMFGFVNDTVFGLGWERDQTFRLSDSKFFDYSFRECRGRREGVKEGNGREIHGVLLGVSHFLYGCFWCCR